MLSRLSRRLSIVTLILARVCRVMRLCGCWRTVLTMLSMVVWVMLILGLLRLRGIVRRVLCLGYVAIGLIVMIRVLVCGLILWLIMGSSRLSFLGC